MSLVLIDTSAWTKALRRDGDPAVKVRVHTLLANETAAWCEIVRVELWRGIKGEHERKEMAQLDRVVE